MLRIIAAEETGIDYHTANNPGQAETNDAPVKARRAPPPRLPTVHPFSQIGIFAFDKDRSGGLEQIFFGRKKIIVGEKHGAAKFFCSEINQFSEFHWRFLTFGIKDKNSAAGFRLRHV